MTRIDKKSLSQEIKTLIGELSNKVLELESTVDKCRKEVMKNSDNFDRVEKIRNMLDKFNKVTINIIEIHRFNTPHNIKQLNTSFDWVGYMQRKFKKPELINILENIKKDLEIIETLNIDLKNSLDEILNINKIIRSYNPIHEDNERYVDGVGWSKFSDKVSLLEAEYIIKNTIQISTKYFEYLNGELVNEGFEDINIDKYNKILNELKAV
jgi:hypothetical protein